MNLRVLQGVTFSDWIQRNLENYGISCQKIFGHSVILYFGHW